MKSDFVKRLLSGMVITAAAVLIFALSFIPSFLPACISAMSVVCTFELLRAVKQHRPVFVIVLGIMGGIIQFMPFAHYLYLCIALLAAAEAGFMLMILKTGTFRITKAVHVMPLCILFAVFARSATEIRGLGHGLFLLILTVCVTELNDVFAYLTGRRLGKHKLAPKVSPKKTIEGSAGGLLLSAASGILITAVYCAAGGFSANWLPLCCGVLMLALQGQFGDLSLSAVKRAAGLDDFGKLIPGHGGMLDRLDSLIFTLPAAYILFVSNAVF